MGTSVSVFLPTSRPASRVSPTSSSIDVQVDGQLANGESPRPSRVSAARTRVPSYDYTAYFERVAKDRLKDVMARGSRPHGELRLAIPKWLPSVR